MKLIAEKYRKLEPRIECLADEVVIAQAWKKTHGYMRTHNWYADTLALDISALGIEANAKAWASALREKGFDLTPLELVPAAKSEQWKVDSERGWVPSVLDENRREKPPIRPLAHLTIRDQTLSTALMLCLADVVETAQGDCGEIKFREAQKKHVYSYGNRLLCDWGAHGAWFRWGNGETYRRFFTDYQNFLRRPVEIGRLVAQELSETDHVYVINLDLEKFYDRIDRSILIDRLKQLAAEQGRTDNPDFWHTAKQIINWKWESEAEGIAEKLGLSLGEGLPQGLVASGFFANAYMTKFDEAIGQHINQGIQKLSGVFLHDYCRYVDDIRLVVSANENVDIAELAKSINEWITSHLHTHASDSLNLNIAKTKITSLSDLDNHGSLSGRIALLQSELSGPADRDVLESATAVLEGLLTTNPEELNIPTALSQDTELIRLASLDNDIRADTLKRFAANRLESIMRSKRKLSAPVEVGSREGRLADNESELLSKKLVRAWMQDPSLGLLLRKAIEIYPSEDIAKPVFDAVFIRSSVSGKSADKLTAAVMNYLLADLFRCCVDFNGFFQYVDFPRSANPEGMLNIAAEYALKAIEQSDTPKFVKRQALLLLAVLQKSVGIQDAEESIQHSLHFILANRLPSPQRQRLALFEVASQIKGSPDSFAPLLLDQIEQLSEEDRYIALEEFAKRGGKFWLAVWKHLQSSSKHNKMLQRLKWAAPIVSISPKLGKQRLSMIIASETNGFEHEAALIKLALGLIKLAKGNEKLLPLAPAEIDIKPVIPSEWKELWRPEVRSITCSTRAKAPTIDPRFSIPDWLSRASPDNAIVYWIGTILRAAVVGSDDFTGNRWKASSVVSYKGLRTGWYKRRMGMMHSAEALVGDYATVSQWFSELLMKCLQWPGFESTHIQQRDIANISSLSDLQGILVERLNELDGLYCNASQIPTLITTAWRPKNIPFRGFRIVTVQQLLPKTEDLKKDPTLNTPQARADNRDHLSRVCNLTYRTLYAKVCSEGGEFNAGADLIVFPEVAIHIDDQDIIKRLADKTRSIVFAGLVFHDHQGKLVNIARWFIPDYRDSGRQWIIRDQGKENMTRIENDLGISGYRPCQHIIKIEDGEDDNKIIFKLGGAICYDATDLKLASDLKDKTDLFIVCAHNKDVSTFDTMASALNYHMYQHVVVVNKGEFGGSTIQAPYREHFERLISHSHGSDQISINVADLNLAAFKAKHIDHKKVKTKPAGS